MDTIAIVGPGRVGLGLGERLAKSGCAVRFGTRDPSDPEPIRARVGEGTEVVSIEDAAAGAAVVFLCVPPAAAVDAARRLGAPAGTIVVDCTNPVAWADGPVLSSPPEGSIAAAVAAAVPTLRVVKGFNAFGAEIHQNPTTRAGPAIVPLAGDDATAKGAVARIAELAGFAPIDVGPLRNAPLLESLAVLWIHIATKGGRGREWAFVMSDLV